MTCFLHVPWCSFSSKTLRPSAAPPAPLSNSDTYCDPELKSLPTPALGHHYFAFTILTSSTVRPQLSFCMSIIHPSPQPPGKCFLFYFSNPSVTLELRHYRQSEAHNDLLTCIVSVNVWELEWATWTLGRRKENTTYYHSFLLSARVLISLNCCILRV